MAKDGLTATARTLTSPSPAFSAAASLSSVPSTSSNNRASPAPAPPAAAAALIRSSKGADGPAAPGEVIVAMRRSSKVNRCHQLARLDALWLGACWLAGLATGTARIQPTRQRTERGRGGLAPPRFRSSTTSRSHEDETNSG